MYNKLFGKILDSSIWLEPTPTRICWITLLAAMDEDGYAHFSAIENLAGRARVTMEEATKAVECFLAPDKNSSDPDHDGRRIERVPGGFMILNAAKHRQTYKRLLQREQVRVRVARHREKKNGGQNSTWNNGEFHHEFIEKWGKAFEEQFKSKYLVSGAKDGSAVKRLAGLGMGVDDLVKTARLAWNAVEEPRWNCQNQSKDIASFASAYNKIVGELAEQEKKRSTI